MDKDVVDIEFEKLLAKRKTQLKDIRVEINKDENNPNYFTKYIRKRQFETPELLSFIGLDCGKRCFVFELGNFYSLPTEHLCYLRCFAKHQNSMEIISKKVEHYEDPELYAQNF